MATNVTDDIVNLLTRHDINLMRLEAGLRRKIIKLINGMGNDVLKILQSVDPASPVSMLIRNKRLTSVMTIAQETLDRYYKTIEKEIISDLKRVSIIESNNIIDTTNSALHFELLSKRLNNQVLRSLANDTLIQGAPTREWLINNKKRYLTQLRRTLRDGIVVGQSIQDMTRRVRGFMPSTRREATAIVRSSVQAVAQEARYETYKANSDVIKGQQWMSTLDGRTTPICQSLDGQAWTLEGEALEGTTAAWQGPPPAHWNCRSTLVPVLKSFGDLANDPQVKRKIKKLDDRERKRLKATALGKPGGRLTYERWLRQQTPAMQKDILGPTRYRMWRRKQITTRDLIDQTNRPLTIEELEAKIRRRHKFKSASDWYNRFAEKGLTEQAILSEFGDDVRKKMDEVIARIEKRKPTNKIYFKNGKWDEERTKIHEDIIKKFLNPKSMRKAKPTKGVKPKYVMFGGRGGSGKGSFTRAKKHGGVEVINKDEFIILDTDEIKKMLPEYQGWNAFEVHEESSYIFDLITERVRQRGLNIVHDMTLKTGSSAIARAKGFIESGYELEGYYMFLPPQDAAKRAVKRFMGPTNRYVPLEVILANTRNEANFDDLLQFFSKWEFYDNQGLGPELIAKG